MENSVSAQLALLGQSVLLGAAAAIGYDLLRPFRTRRPKALWIWDGLFCLCAGVSIFLFLLRQAGGVLRLYHLLGVLAGAGLFSALFSRALRPVWEFWCVTLLWTLRLLSLPGRWLAGVCKKTARRCKNLFYFMRKCATMKKMGSYRGLFSTKEAETVAKNAAAVGAKRTKIGSGFLSKLLILVLLLALSWQLYRLRQQVEQAQAQQASLSEQVESQQQANDELSQRIEQGGSQEEMEEIARDELGLVSPGERVFHDISN